MAEYKMINPHEFSVVQFFKNGAYEKVRQFVSADEAVAAFSHYTDNVATKIGLVVRVIITDGGDCINMEWQRGKGITYPFLIHKVDTGTEEDLKKIIRDYHANKDGE
jgi:hypothetical protein